MPLHAAAAYAHLTFTLIIYHNILRMVLKFVHPSTIIVSGPTQAGKTCFVINCLKNEMFEVAPSKLNRDDLDRKFPDRLIWIKGQDQPDDAEVDKIFKNVEWNDSFKIDPPLNPKDRSLIIIDDMMLKVKNDKKLTSLFIQESHHLNATVMFIVQNPFEKGSEMKTVANNAHYKVLFNNPNDQLQISLIGSRCFPGSAKEFVQIFNDATRKPFRYLLLDSRPETPSNFRLRSKIFPGENTRVYQMSHMKNDQRSIKRKSKSEIETNIRNKLSK